jgi:hypothetical protein
MEINEGYFNEKGKELATLQIHHTEKAVLIMQEVKEKLIAWENSNNRDINQLQHALDESIGLLKEYNKGWEKKKRYSPEDYKKFSYQINIVAGRLSIL